MDRCDMLLDNIAEIRDSLPKKQRELCNYVLLNPQEVGLSTVAALASKAGVGTTTVLRLVENMGFSSYTDFKIEIMNDYLISTTSSYHQLKESFSELKEGDSRFGHICANSIRTIENLFSKENIQQFDKAIDYLLEAENIYTLGYRSSRSLTGYFAHNVACFSPNVYQLNTEGEFIYDRIALSLTHKDVLLVVSAWPCTKKTVEVALLCKRMNTPVVLVTNTKLNPIYKMADVVINTNSVNDSSGGTAFMVVIESLIAELGRRMAPQSTKNLEIIEKVLNDNDLIIWEDGFNVPYDR